MLNKNFRKMVTSTVLGLSVITASICTAGFTNPVTVEAAVLKKPVVNFKAKTITVGLGSQLDVYKNVITSVKKGTYPVKSVKLTAVKAANGCKISVKNSSSLTAGKIPAKTLKFPAKSGTYKLKVVATDTKGNKKSSTVSFKVRTKKLSGYVTGMKDLRVEKGSSVNFMKGIKFNKSYVKSVKANSAAVDINTVGTYKAYYNIVGIAGDKQKVAKKVTVYKENSGSVTPSTNPAAHVKGISDRVVVARSRGINFMKGITWDDTIKSVEVTNFGSKYDPTNFDLPWDYNHDFTGLDANYYYKHTGLTYKITPKSGSAVEVKKHMYIVDLPTAKDLANNNVTVYSSNNVPIQPDPNVHRTCDLQVSATKIVVPRHPLYVCFNCNTEIAKLDYDGIDEHNNDSYFGKEGSVPGCSSGWLTAVEAFTINR